MKKFLILILVIIFNTNCYAMNLEFDNIVKDYYHNEFPLDINTINSPINISGDNLNNFDYALLNIFDEPSVSSNYQKMCELLFKSNFFGTKMFVDGLYIDFSNYDNVEPALIDGRALVPLRALSENLGAQVEWNNEEKSVLITQFDIVIKVFIDSKKAYVNNVEKYLDVPAQMINGRTMLPTRFISETFNKTVEWHTYYNCSNIIAIY